ncbi:MAG: hypothetical protein JO129_01925, partial [Candidatus Dependentiae bacterium]|nr:hypothetical protein [Candidatus Dependentiae bacterium]
MITNKTIVRIAVIVQMILCAESQLQASSWWGNADAQSTSRGETDAQFIARMQEKLKSAPVVSQEEREYKNYLDPEDFDKSGQLIHPSRRYLIADIDKKYPEYKEGFRVIGRGDNGFYNFLQENLSYDENKDEASNAEQVLIDAKEKIINGLKNSFIRGFKEDNPRFVQDN